MPVVRWNVWCVVNGVWSAAGWQREGGRERGRGSCISPNAQCRRDIPVAVEVRLVHDGHGETKTQSEHEEDEEERKEARASPLQRHGQHSQVVEPLRDRRDGRWETENMGKRMNKRSTSVIGVAG